MTFLVELHLNGLLEVLLVVGFEYFPVTLGDEYQKKIIMSKHVSENAVNKNGTKTVQHFQYLYIFGQVWHKSFWLILFLVLSRVFSYRTTELHTPLIKDELIIVVKKTTKCK